MKLSQENIQFIDRYLKNSGVEYFDIRMEMLDHVATAVEQKMETESLDFYDAFKSYMVINKKDLMKENKDDSNISFSKEVLVNFFKFLIKPAMLCVLFLYVVLFSFFNVNNFFSEKFTLGNLFGVVIISIALFQIFYFYIYLKERFFVVERLSSGLLIIYSLQIFFGSSFKEEQPSNYISIFFSYIITVYLVFFIKEIIRFNKKRTILLQ